MIKAIDAHTGSSDWRQICYLEEGMHELLKNAYTEYEDRRIRRLEFNYSNGRNQIKKSR